MATPRLLQTKTNLYHNPKLEIRRSALHRWGVFAKEDIKCHEILEEAPYFTISNDEVSSAPSAETYCYWLDDNYAFIGMGYCGLYNHSFNPNADYLFDKINEVVTHYASSDIAAGDEITIDYGVENAACFDCYPEEDQTEIE